MLRSLSSLCVISRFLSLISLIPLPICYALYPMLTSSLLISFIELFISNIFACLFFEVSVSLVKHLLNSLFSELMKLPVCIFLHFVENFQNSNLEFSSIYVTYFCVCKLVCLEIFHILSELPCYLGYLWYLMHFFFV